MDKDNTAVAFYRLNTATIIADLRRSQVYLSYAYQATIPEAVKQNIKEVIESIDYLIELLGK